jgi:DNA-binding NarL/FixJ family response regulator
MARLDPTPTQLKLLPLVALGLSNGEIAWRLGYSVVTIHGYVEQLRHRLGATNRIELLLIADSRGLIDLHQVAVDFELHKEDIRTHTAPGE